MAWLTCDQRLEITRLYGADDHTNVDTSRLQHRPLLDMCDCIRVKFGCLRPDVPGLMPENSHFSSLKCNERATDLGGGG